MDITQLILDDHQEQRRLFAILEGISGSETASLASNWNRLARFLELHAETEERIFYPKLLQLGREAHKRDQVEEETLDAIKDHNEIRDAVSAVSKEEVGTPAWLSAVAAANKANSDHMAEEEREGLTDFRRWASLELRHQLGVEFITYEADHALGVPAIDKDPRQWVATHG